MGMTGGEAVAKMLSLEGVEKVFGIIDGTYFGLYSSLKKYNIELISPRHEACAVHMAGTYARLTGKLGVCIASNGPGVANLLSGIAVENAEGNRVMAITSSRRPQIIYPDRGGTFQCIDHTGSIGPISKYSEAVKSEDRMFEIMRQGFRKCYEGRPGVVHVDIPENFLNGKGNYPEQDFLSPYQYRNTHGLFPHPSLTKQAAELLVNASFPIIHAGSGITHSRAYEELETLVNTLKTPVTTSWGGRGVLPECNELAVPMYQVEANDQVRNQADVVLILGSRLGETDWWGKRPNWADAQTQKVIQVDLEGDFIGRNKPITLGIQADVKLFLQELVTEVQKIGISESTQKNRLSQFENFKTIMTKNRAKLDEHLKDQESPMNSAHIGAVAKKVFKNDSIAVFDGGNTSVWGQFFYSCNSPGQGIGTPKMGMLGAGVAQALGAAIAKPETPVYCIIGDGAMGFNLQEIETAVRYGLHVVYLIAVDRQWGMVKMNQSFALRPIKTMIKKSLDPGENINADFNEIKFDEVARSMGAKGFRVSNPTDYEQALQAALDYKDGPSVVHIDVDPVKHMWAPALLTFKKMHDEPKGK